MTAATNTVSLIQSTRVSLMEKGISVFRVRMVVGNNAVVTAELTNRVRYNAFRYGVLIGKE